MRDLRAGDFVAAARVPDTLRPQRFGRWNITRRPYTLQSARYPWPTYTVLCRHTEAGMHLIDDDGWGGEVVMEDGLVELCRHLPIWMAARGRVLVTGLGLGCVVRGLLASPDVDHVDVVEIDQAVIDIVGPEFAGDPRLTMHQGDATAMDLPGEWDFAWHDLHTDHGSLALAHAKALTHWRHRCRIQGAWLFPRTIARFFPVQLLGSQRRPRLRFSINTMRRATVNTARCR